MEYVEITDSPDEAALGGESGVFLVATAKELDAQGDQVGWRSLAWLDDGVAARLRGAGYTVNVLRDSGAAALQLASVLGGDGAVPIPALPRADLGAELLNLALGFLGQRLDIAAHGVLGSVPSLRGALGVPDSPELNALFDRVVGAVDAFFARLDNPYAATTLDDLTEAVTVLAGGLAATVRLAGAGAARALVTTILGAAIPGEFPAALGLGAATPGIVVGADEVVLRYAVPQPRVLGVFAARSARLTARMRYTDRPALVVTVAVDGLALTPAASSLLALAGLDKITADVEIGVDTATGFVFGGGVHGTEVRVPLGSAQPGGKAVRVSGLELATARRGGGLALSITGSATGRLGGALAVSAAGLGVSLLLDPDDAGVLSTPKMLLPKGFGIVIDAGPVAGGGFLAVRDAPGHPEWTRYDGALVLRVGPVEVAAFAVLTDRPGGFSFVAVMSVLLSPPAELGLLFTLNGVGGLIGAEVAADTDAMARSVGTGAISALLFPADPAAAAPAILDTLAAFFPPRAGGFVVAPMLKLGWGRPVWLVTADVAVVLSLPDPKILVLGKLRVAIPAPSVPIIDLRAEIYGEFSEDRILILASLVDSRIGFFSVAGDLGLLIRFGDAPAFVVSAGGFHPRFAPPPELARLRRVQADISPPLFSLRVEAYAAVTPGVVQFGGAVQVRYGVKGTGIFGHAALDALIRLNPFGFEVDMLAGVAIRVLGATVASATLRLHLEGPAPWVAWGTGEVGLPWPLPDISLDVGPIRWGADRPTPPAEVSPIDLVVTALEQRRAWTTADGAARGGVVLAETTAGLAMLVDPWSVLTGVQEVVPLDLDIVRVGGSPVRASETRIALGQPEFVNMAPDEGSGERPERWGDIGQCKPVPATFAAGEYLDLDDDEILSRPAFEKTMTGGLVINPDGLAQTSTPVAVAPHYVTSFPHRGGRRLPSAGAASAVEGIALSATAAATGALRTRYRVPVTPFELADPAQALVRSRIDLRSVDGVTDTALTWSAAAEAARGTDAQVVSLGAVPQ